MSLVEAASVRRRDDEAAISGLHPTRLAPAIEDAVSLIGQGLALARRIPGNMDAAGGLAGAYLAPLSVEGLENAVDRSEDVRLLPRELYDAHLPAPRLRFL